jgi:hypothetical protein
VGNRRGWRLPTLQELNSLIDTSGSIIVLALPAGHPFTNVQSGSYWSATTKAASTSRAWSVSLDDGDLSGPDKDSQLFVWCVRGGQGVDPQ